VSDQATAQAPRVRVSAAQSAKGIWQIDATVERFDGLSPVPMLVDEIKEAQAALREAGHKLASDAAA
jgi:hypothetical protein